MSSYLLVKSIPSNDEWNHEVLMWCEKKWEFPPDVDYLNERNKEDGDPSRYSIVDVSENSFFTVYEVKKGFINAGEVSVVGMINKSHIEKQLNRGIEVNDG